MEQVTKQLWTWQYVLALTLTFLFFLSLQALLGGFPVYVIHTTENPANGGLMTTAFMFAAVLSRPAIGAVMNRINMKKALVLTVIYIFFAISLSFFWTSVVALVVLRVLQGLGFGIISTLLATMVTNIVPHHRLGEGIGYFGMATSIGTTIGPMVALTFIHEVSFNAVLIFSLILIGLIFAGALVFKHDDMQPSPVTDEPKKSLLQSTFDAKALFPCILLFAFYITFTGNVNFLDGLGKSLGIGRTSLFFFILMIMLLVTRPFSGRIYDRKGHQFLLYPSLVSAIIGLILLSHMQNIRMLVTASLFYGLAYGVMQPTLQAWAVTRVHASNKATANAMALSFMDLGHAIGAVLLGIAVRSTGYQSMYDWMVLLSVILLLVYIVFNRRAKMLQRQKANQDKRARI